MQIATSAISRSIPLQNESVSPPTRATTRLVQRLFRGQSEILLSHRSICTSVHIHKDSDRQERIACANTGSNKLDVGFWLCVGLMLPSFSGRGVEGVTPPPSYSKGVRFYNTKFSWMEGRSKSWRSGIDALAKGLTDLGYKAETTDDLQIILSPRWAWYLRDIIMDLAAQKLPPIEGAQTALNRCEMIFMPPFQPPLSN